MMSTDHFEPELPPECRATMERVQRALDGDAPLDADLHTVSCPMCRERLRAARTLLAALAIPSELAAVPAGFTDRIVNAVRADARAETRRRVYQSAAAILALAAAVLIAVYSFMPTPLQPAPGRAAPPMETAKLADVAPAPREKAPIRIGDEFAKAGQSLRDAPKPFTDSVAVAPKLLDALTGPFTSPMLDPNPMGAGLEPARKTLAELPDAARSSIEPVTGTAQKAFDRLLRDVAFVKP